MPESRLWALDQYGRVYRLSNYQSQWQPVSSGRSKVRHFKLLSAASWVVWALGCDHQVYLMVPATDLKIRFQEIVFENERWSPLGGFSGKHLLSTDPAHFSLSSDFNGAPCTRRNLQLPSARWQWEDAWYVQETLHGEYTDKGGWQYSHDFWRTFGCQRHVNSFVRRRKWVRWRRFSAEDRWLLVASPHDNPLEDPLLDVAVGGELIPHRPDGALSIWAVTVAGRLLARFGVERLCPEGISWQVVEAPMLDSAEHICQPAHIRSVAVGPLANVWVVSDDGHIWLRSGISWQLPLGCAWWRVPTPASDPKVPHERVIQLAVGSQAVWATANTGRVWFRKDVNLVDHLQPEIQMGTQWIEMVGSLRVMSMALYDQLWAIEFDTHQLVWRSGVDATSLSGKTWKPLTLAVNCSRLRLSSQPKDCKEDCTIPRKCEMLSLPLIKLRPSSVNLKTNSNLSDVIESAANTISLSRQRSLSDDIRLDKTIDYITLPPQPLNFDYNKVHEDSLFCELKDQEDEDDAGLNQFSDPAYLEPVPCQLTHLSNVSAAALRLESNDLPTSWQRAPKQNMNFQVTMLLNCNWRAALMERLESRDAREHQCAAFCLLENIVDHSAWQKRGQAQYQFEVVASGSENSSVAVDNMSSGSHGWRDVALSLEQQRDGVQISSNLTLHWDFAQHKQQKRSASLSNPLILSTEEMTCVAKLPESRPVIGVYMMGEQDPHRLALATEEEAEEWISCLSSVLCEQRNKTGVLTPHRLAAVTRRGDIFFSEDSMQSSIAHHFWRQFGGHVRIVRCGAQGVTWALGCDGTAWFYNGGYGGGFLRGMNTTRRGVQVQYDLCQVATYEYQRWSLLRGYSKHGYLFDPYMWSDEQGKLQLPRESFRLWSRSWNWFSEWHIDLSSGDNANADDLGWQYARDFGYVFESQKRWNSGVRRRRWLRQFRVQDCGPWIEVGGPKLRDVSISAWTSSLKDDCAVWAVSASGGELLRRCDVSSLLCNGSGWRHVAAEHRCVAVSVSGDGRVWTLAEDGAAWLRLGITSECLDGISWLPVGRPKDGTPLRNISACFNQVWAVDAKHRLWRRQDVHPHFPEGLDWILVEQGPVSIVSCGTDDRVFAVLGGVEPLGVPGGGVLAERCGISPSNLSGDSWERAGRGLWADVCARGAVPNS